MSKSLNEVVLIGNLGKDPEIRTLDNGVPVATFPLATSTGGYEKQDGTKVEERTQWHNIVAWRSLAKLAEYFKSGTRVCVKGMISYRSYDKDGSKRYITDIIAHDIIPCGGASGDNGRPEITKDDMPEDIQDDLPVGW